jgi:hypothetical protein
MEQGFITILCTNHPLIPTACFEYKRNICGLQGFFFDGEAAKSLDFPQNLGKIRLLKQTFDTGSLSLRKITKGV